MKVTLVKAFTTDPSQGNPAGVALAADNLSDSQKQEIAAALNFSESAFIESSDKADFKVRFFSPTQEVDFCGHATVAAFHTLIEAGLIAVQAGEPTIVTQETNIGVLEVRCFANGMIMMSQKMPDFAEVFKDRKAIAGMIGLKERDLLESPIQIVSTGARQLIIPVKGLQQLRSVTPDLSQIMKHSKRYDQAGACVIAPVGFTKNSAIATRNFAPIFGIDEDAATGIAAGAIAWYADKYWHAGAKKQFTIEQGFDMDMSSTITARITDGTLVGGRAVRFDERIF